MLKPTEELAQKLEDTTDIKSEEEAKNILDSLPPEEKAARIFGAMMPEFKKKVADLSKNQLKRVIIAITEAPLNDEKFQFYLQSEVDAFNLGMMIQDAKFTMYRAALIDKAIKEQEAAQTEEKKEESNETLQG